MSVALGRGCSTSPSRQEACSSDERLCMRCHTYFRVDDQSSVCRYHPATYVCRYHPEGEKYYAAVETNDAHRGWNGKCWECCGNEDKNAIGCITGKHVTYD